MLLIDIYDINVNGDGGDLFNFILLWSRTIDVIEESCLRVVTHKCLKTYSVNVPAAWIPVFKENKQSLKLRAAGVNNFHRH